MKKTEDFIFELDGDSDGWQTRYSFNEVTKAMIEFAKMHVEEALKQASENVLLEKGHDFGQYSDSIAKFDKGYCKVFSNTSYGHGDCSWEAVRPNKESILNSYPLENIK